MVPLLEVSAHLPKLGQLQPAGLGGAAPRHTVAFASPLHGPFHCLQGDQREEFKEKKNPEGLFLCCNAYRTMALGLWRSLASILPAQ